jgi:hypothetical protein
MSSSDKSKLDGLFTKDYTVSLTKDTAYTVGLSYVAKYPYNTILYFSVTYDLTEDGLQYGRDGFFVIASYSQQNTYNFSILGSYFGLTMQTSSHLVITPKYYNTIMNIYKVFSPS